MAQTIRTSQNAGGMYLMVDTNDVVSTITLKPDAHLVKALGSHHTLESAIADLVDNSVDAKATRVSIRLLTENNKLVRIEVVDNGEGMDSDSIDRALTLGLQREYDTSDLGHFGVGLKAASLGHCDVLTVWSSRSGTDPVGRRITRTEFAKDFSCDVLSMESARTVQTKRNQQIGSANGTTIVWSGLRTAFHGHSDEASQWLSASR
jgi:DNA topoisomerase VI subunit B